MNYKNYTSEQLKTIRPFIERRIELLEKELSIEKEILQGIDKEKNKQNGEEYLFCFPDGRKIKLQELNDSAFEKKCDCPNVWRCLRNCTGLIERARTGKW